jgi:hypothetical protein
MKKLAIMMFMFATSLAAQNVAGIWNGQGGIVDAKYGVVPTTVQMTLLQDGSALQGTFKVGNGKPGPIKSGSVSGTQVVFTVGPATAALTLNSNNQLVGKMTSSTGKIVNFIFTKLQTK